MKYCFSKSLLLAGVSASALCSANAANYYLNQNHFNPNHWETVSNTNGWYTTDGGSTQLTVFDNTGDYFNNGYNLFTRSAQDTFDGNSLTLSGARMELRYHDVSLNSTVGTMIVDASGSSLSTNDTSSNAQGGGLSVTSLTLNGSFGVSINDFRRVRLNVGSLDGSGDLNFGVGGGSGTRSVFSATDASAFSGGMNLVQGRLDFDSDFVSGGGFNIASGTTFVLDQDLTFTSLNIAGTDYGAGEYSFSFLDGAHGSIFQSGGTGSITVAAIPEPSTFAMLAGFLALASVSLRRRRA